MPRLLPVAFIALLVACLTVPLLQTLFPVFGTIVKPVNEHRAPHAFPSLQLLTRAHGDFADGLNKWFDDRAGFRDLFIRAKNQIDYSVFSTSRRVYVGSDDWLFERDPGLPLERLDAAGFEALTASFGDLARRLQEKGLRLVVVGYPDKSMVYPEHVPANGRLLLPGGNHDRLRRFLSNSDALTFIDVEDILRREKPANPEHLYFKTDLHATAFAQVAVAREIVARIAQIENRGDVTLNETFGRLHDLWDAGNEARFLAPLVPVVEKVTGLGGAYVVGGQDSTGRWTVPDIREFDRAEEGIAPLFAWEYQSTDDLCARRLPGTVLWGNSFADLYSAVGLHRYFCSFRRFHIQNSRIAFDRLALLLDSVPPGTKYFIYQYYAPLLHNAPFVGFTAQRAQ
ncbi:alginate O-acetyltransferase AlgX-related protein [Reyranella sp.]|uniref:alginate O-acetyltransferase AlgX-related protein n=1 Tax=Reyranella sp. TaxID=1929291 RepID=UPI003BA9A95B